MSLIDSISGILFLKTPARVVVDISGIRFQVNISISCFESLPDLGKQIEILTYLHVKDDILDLYGFKDLNERSLFKYLNMISGIGPRSAMNILSGTNPEKFKKSKRRKRRMLSRISINWPKIRFRLPWEVKKVLSDFKRKRRHEKSKRRWKRQHKLG